MSTKIAIPEFITSILKTLSDAGHEGYCVGGCVRDSILGKTPYDWDLATSATPDQIQELFPDSFCENDFGTVTLKMISEDHPDAVVPEGFLVEITPYRAEHGYSDNRRPDNVEFGVSLEEDLSRRDFTINAMAYDGEKIVDLHNGQKDLADEIIRTVGEPEERFGEDALRLMRAVRFATQLGFVIEPKTKDAITKLAPSLANIAVERVRDELIKIVDAPKKPSHGFVLMHETGLLTHVIPELGEGVGCEQNHHHIYDVFTHNVLSMDFAAEYEYPLYVKFAALLHDVAKPMTKEGTGKSCTFYNHDLVGGKMTRDIMKRLKFPKDFGKRVVTLVRHHMFFYDVDAVTEAAIRRLVKRVGPENIQDLLKVRIAERKGSGVPKARPYRLRHLEYMIEKVARDPVSVKMLKLNGDIMISEMKMEPGPKMGWILHALLEEVLDDPSKNDLELQKERATELAALPDSELAALAKAGEDKAREEEEAALAKIKKKFHVQ